MRDFTATGDACQVENQDKFKARLSQNLPGGRKQRGDATSRAWQPVQEMTGPFPFHRLEPVKAQNLPVPCTGSIVPQALQYPALHTLYQKETVKYQTDSSRMAFEGLPRLPGTGQSYADCGRLWLEVCPEGHEKKLRKHSCNRWECPICFKGVAARDAKDAVERIEESIRLHHVPYRPGHVVFSFDSDEGQPQPGEQKADAIRRLRARLNAAVRAESSGPVGGKVIAHDRRLNAEGQRRYERARQQAQGEGRTLKKWDWFLAQSDREGLSCWSPHFHFEGCIFLEKSGGFAARTGLVYKRIGRPHSEDEARRVIAYQLQHHALIEGVRTVTWIGFASYNKTGCKQSNVKEVAICQTCKSELVTVPPEFVNQANGELVGPLNAMPFETFNRVLRFKKKKLWYVSGERIRPDSLPGA